MNIPHLAPIRFAQAIVDVNEIKAIVFCDFLKLPSLAMFIEAAAQSSSAFDNSLGKPKVGFLTVAKDVRILQTIKESTFLIKILCEVALKNIKQFSFEAFENNSGKKVVIGSFTLFIQEEF